MCLSPSGLWVKLVQLHDDLYWFTCLYIVATVRWATRVGGCQSIIWGVMPRPRQWRGPIVMEAGRPSHLLIAG